MEQGYVEILQIHCLTETTSSVILLFVFFRSHLKQVWNYDVPLLEAECVYFAKTGHHVQCGSFRVFVIFFMNLFREALF